MTQADAGNPGRDAPAGPGPGPGSLPRRVRIALAFAMAWGVLLLVASIVAPAYTGESVTSTGATARSTYTLVEENGWSVLGVMALPLVAALLVAALVRGAARGSPTLPRPRRLAWVVVGALGVLTLLSMMTVGLFLLPVPVALAIALAGSPARTPR